MKLIVIALMLLFVSCPVIKAGEIKPQKIKSLEQLKPTLIPWVEKINGLDRKYFIGKTLLVPSDTLTAANFKPCPDSLPQQVNQAKFILIDLSAKYLAAYEHGQLAFWLPITSGRRSGYTPVGNFSIQHKWRLIVSRKYGGVAMPYALHLINSICIHQGPMVGRPASHGCIRLFKRDAIKLYGWAKIGTAVCIQK